MLAVYFIQNLTVFDTPGPMIIFYFSLGLVYFFTVSLNNKNTAPQNLKNKNSSLVIIIPLLIMLPIGLYSFNFKPLNQSLEGFKGVSVSRTDLATGINFYKQSLATKSFVNPEIRLQLAKTISEQTKDNPDYGNGLALAVQEMAKNTQEHPLDARYWLYLGQLYDLNNNPDDARAGQNALEKALSLSPKRQQIYFELAKNQIIQKNYSTAIEYARQSIELDPKIGLSHYDLGLIYFASQEYSKMLEEYAQAEQLGYNPFRDKNGYLTASTAYAELNNMDMALDFAEKGLKKWPNDKMLIIQKIVLLQQAEKTKELNDFINQLAQENPQLLKELGGN